MASDGNPGSILITSLVQGRQAPAAANAQPAGGKTVPAGGNNVSGAAAGGQDAGHAAAADPQSLVNSLNKYLNDSGRPDQFRLDPASRNKLIQEINPATGAVIGEFSIAEFPALARSIGATSLLIDSRV